MGSFIIVDLLHFGTVGAGMVIAPQAQAQKASTDVVWQPTRVTAAIRANQKSQKPAVVWFTGPFGRGQIDHRQCARTGAGAAWPPHLPAGRRQRAPRAQQAIWTSPRPVATRTSAASARCRRCSWTPGLIVHHRVHFALPRRPQPIRERIGEEQFIEVYLSTSLEDCEKRDPKGLYVKARAGQIREFTGIDSPYEPPMAPQMTIDTSKVNVPGAVEQILRYLENKGFLNVTDPGL